MLLLIGQGGLVAGLWVELIWGFLRWAHTSEQCRVSELLLLDRVEDLLLLRAVSADRLSLGEGCSVHVLEELVFLSKLVFEDLQLGADLAVLISEAVNLHLGVHVLLVKVFS